MLNRLSKSLTARVAARLLGLLLVYFLTDFTLPPVMSWTPAASAQVVPNYHQSNFKNILANPRLDIYPAGTTEAYTSSTLTGTLTGLNTTPTYLAARWAAWSNNSSASVTIANVTTGLPSGFGNGVSLTRAVNNTQTAPICYGQEIRTADMTGLQGQQLTFSLWAAAGSGFSAASSNLTLQAVTGTGTDQGLATYISGWTGAATPETSNQAISTTFGRYAATFTVPSNATEMLVEACWTPVGTAVSNDNVTLTGLQLEQGTRATSFEERSQVVENNNFVLPYTQVYTDGAATRRYGMCAVSSATSANCVLPLQVPMWKIPTTTVGTSASFAVTGSTNSAENCTAFAAVGTSNTVDTAAFTCTTTAIVQGEAGELVGQNTAGLVLISSDF